MPRQESSTLSADSPLFIYASRVGLSAIDMTAPSPRTPVQLDGTPSPDHFAVAHARKAVFYFRFGEPYYSVSRLTFILLDLTTLIDTTLDRQGNAALVRSTSVAGT